MAISECKTCSTCKVIKPRSEFFKRRKNEPYVYSKCRDCKNAAQREYYNKDPERRRYYNKRQMENHHERMKNPEYRKQRAMKHKAWRVKISIEDVYRLSEVKNCSICGACRDEGAMIYLDHDHKVDKFRGVLCSACNSMLGFAKDNADILRKGAEYLEKGLVHGFVDEIR